MQMTGSNQTVILSSYVDKKFGTKHTNRTGITAKGLLFDLDYNLSPNFPHGGQSIEQFAHGKDDTMILSAFSNSTIRLTEKLTANIGIVGQYFALNKEITIEPRTNLTWNI